MQIEVARENYELFKNLPRNTKLRVIENTKLVREDRWFQSGRRYWEEISRLHIIPLIVETFALNYQADDFEAVVKHLEDMFALLYPKDANIENMFITIRKAKSELSLSTTEPPTETTEPPTETTEPPTETTEPPTEPPTKPTNESLPAGWTIDQHGNVFDELGDRIPDLIELPPGWHDKEVVDEPMEQMEPTDELPAGWTRDQDGNIFDDEGDQLPGLFEEQSVCILEEVAYVAPVTRQRRAFLASGDVILTFSDEDSDDSDSDCTFFEWVREIFGCDSASFQKRMN